MAFTNFLRDRQTYVTTLVSGSGSVDVSVPIPTDRVMRVHVHGLLTQNTGGHVTGGDNIGGECVVKNNNGVISFATANASSVNPMNTSSLNFTQGYAWVNDVKNSDSATVGMSFVLSGTNVNLRVDVGAVSNAPALDVWLWVETWQAGYA